MNLCFALTQAALTRCSATAHTVTRPEGGAGSTSRTLQLVHRRGRDSCGLRNRGKLKVKAAGGIKDLNTALAMLYAGADRLGTSRSVAILAELRENSHGR